MKSGYTYIVLTFFRALRLQYKFATWHICQKFYSLIMFVTNIKKLSLLKYKLLALQSLEEKDS